VTTAASAESSGARLGREYGKKASRFLVVSAFNVLFGQSLLVLAHSGFGWAFTTSNVFAVGLSAGPAYVLARYWVWEKTSKNHFVKEVLPFWGLAFLGLTASTIAAGVGERYSDAQILLNLVNLAAFGIIWVFKFFILDRYMFGRHRNPVVADSEGNAPPLPASPDRPRLSP
jgi:putative flippase GtrA